MVEKMGRRIRRRGLEAAGYGGNEAFRCREANLLPVTKFIASGLFTKCLGQVDLPDAPLYIVPPIPCCLQPPPPDPPGFFCR
ncbi:hypothetical protein K040078D81_42270 [Blautia hominis]|uniref:Uncharacterized protein n=1 Tax=Blautia hominis TaxID=2025493 RepID=A0ABQ0BF63_9FIRM